MINEISAAKSARHKQAVAGISDNGITFSGLDPVLASLGLLIGLLTKPDPTQDVYQLNPDWFSNPITNTQLGITDNPEQFEQLLTSILGKIGGNALGIPIQDASLLGTWYPIKNGNDPTGFYLVSYLKETNGLKETVMGLGVLHTWKVPPPPGTPLLTVNVWGLMPFVAIGNGSFKITFTDQGYPISLGVAAEGGDTKLPLVDINGISFDGVKFSALIDVAASDPFSVSLEVLSLKLGSAPPANKSLADLLAISGQEMLEIATNLFMGALSYVFPNQQQYLNYITPLLGLSSQIPNLPNVKLPVMEWYNLFEVASNPAKYPDGVKTLFFNWFNALCTDTDALKGWITALSGFLGNTNLQITGTGTRIDPFRLGILNVSSIGQLDFAVATTVDEGGIRYFYPGFSFTGSNVPLGSSPAVFTAQANLELGQFGLSAQAVTAAPEINFQFQFALKNKTTGQPLVAYDGNSVGSLTAGLILGSDGKIVPDFSLNQVVTTTTSFDKVNLLSPGELAEAGAAALSAALGTLIGIGSSDFADNIGALIGLITPVSAKTNWPTTLPAPFSGTQMVHSILNPVKAWSDYYLAVLQYSTAVDGKAAFAYIIQEMALLLQQTVSGLNVTVTGSGTKDDPWMAGIALSSSSLPAFLTAFKQVNTDNSIDLILGLSLQPTITVGNVEIAPSLNLEALGLHFPANGVDIEASWLLAVSAQLQLPKGFMTPSLGGVVVSVSKSQLSAEWNRLNGWGWSMFVQTPKLVINGQDIILGQDLNFDQQTNLKDLVLNAVPAFSPFLVGALGALLMRVENRAALFAIGALGLIPDITKSPVFPTGLSWSGFQQLKLNSLSNPWPDLRNYLSATFASAANAKSLLSLLSYVVNTNIEAAPATGGSGTFNDPWTFPLPKGFEGITWYESTGQIIGLGAGRSNSWQYQLNNGNGTTKFGFDLHARVNALKYNLSSGTLLFDGQVPSFSLTGILYNPDGMLVNLPASLGSVEKIMVGCNLSYDTTNKAFQFDPIVTLFNVTLPGQQQQAQLTLQDFLDPGFTAALQNGFMVLLNAGLQQAFDQVKAQPLFQQAYTLLSMLGLTMTPDGETDLQDIQLFSLTNGLLGINTAGWTGLLANFNTYIQSQFNSLLAIKEQRSLLYNFLSEIFGIQIPNFPLPVLQLLQGMGICGPAEEGYTVYPYTLLDLISNPYKTFQQLYTQLFDIANADNLKQLAAHLSRNLGPYKTGSWTFSTDSTGVISFGILPADAFQLGSFLLVSGGIQLDLSNEKLQGTLDIYCENIGITLRSGFTLKLEEGILKPAFTAAAIWGDGSKPAAQALELIPFNTNVFLNNVADLAPAFTLNILLNAVFEEQLLKQYPLIQQIFIGLGLGEKMPTESLAVQKVVNGKHAIAASVADQQWQMPALMGILENPLGWLLSDDVLGTNGRFSISKLVQMLSHLPAVQASNGIKVTPDAKGMKISGMPYGFEIAMSGENEVATFGFDTKDLVISDNWGTLNLLSFNVSVDSNYQPSFGGELTISSGSKIPVAFFVNTGYDKDFFLNISQGKPDTPSGISLQLLPFLGWGTLAEQAARLAAAAVLKNLVPTVLQQLSNTGAKAFVDKLIAFGDAVNTTELVDNIIKVLTPAAFATTSQEDLLEKIEQVALAWLQEKFTTSGAPVTVQGLITLLKDVMPGVSAQGGRLAFTPDSKIPITILAGLNDKGFLGLWADFSLPDTQVLKIQIAETGVGVKLDGTLDFSFALDVLIPVDDSSGPGLTFAYDLNKGFNLVFDPTSDSTDFSKHSDLAIELLPNFFSKPTAEAGAMQESVTDWLLQVVKVVLPRYVSLLVLNIEKVKGWLEAPIVSSVAGAPTPATLLEATSLILKNNGKYELNSIDNLTKLTPSGFFGNLFYTLMQTELTLLQFGDKNSGKITVGPRTGKQDYYGVRVAAPNLKITALPNLVIQLGADDTEWIDKSSTNKITGDPGIGFYLPITKSGNNELNVDFSLFNLLLYNLGFDIVGTNGKPIVDQPRFKIGAVQPRTVFELDFKGNAKPGLQFGAGVTLAKIGLSLAPDKLAGSGGTNPIANNILGSGSTSGNPPVNPEFSVSTAYTDKLWVNLKSNTGNGSQVIVPIERSFGPLYIDSLGLGWEDTNKLLDFLFSGNVAMAGLKASVVGLTVGVPVTNPTDFSQYKADLQGLDISFNGGAVAINGGFLKTESIVNNAKVIMYNGVAVIKAGTFSLMALGSYAEVPVSPAPDAAKMPSLFIFAVLNSPLGGPPFLFITGIAAGFSFNRGLVIPDISQVQDFPLLKGLVDGTFAEGEDPGKALEQLSSVVYPEVGQYWLAAGVKFTSFELLTTSALLFLSFGKEWEVNLLGLSFTSLPPKIPRNMALAYFELAIKISFRPTEGVISAEAQLTPNSFVLSKDVKVTGGFAFYLWFKNIKTSTYTIPAGDFVISLGGYHPDFNKPAWYPSVPRLGMQWKMDISVGSISISGGAYFALCPTAVMAGGYLNVAYQLGPLKAWLNASADFLIEWNPFYFNVGISITVGASFGTTILGVSITLRAELGATLRLQGPPTHGYVKVDWFVISFTIPVGSGETATKDQNITWAAFAEAFLPPPAVPGSTMGNAKRKVSVANETPVQQVLKLNPDYGLLSDNDNQWTIQPYPFSLSAKSSIPASNITVTASNFSQKGVSVGVRPMGYIDNLNAPLTITLTDSKGNPVDLSARKIKMVIDTNGAPSAMWSQDPLDRNKPPQSNEMLIPGASFGILLDGDEYNYLGNVPAFNIENLKYDIGAYRMLPYKQVIKFPPAARYPASDQNNAYHVIMHSIMNEPVIVQRNIILEGIAASNILAPLNPDLSVMASSADMILQALPVIARLAVFQNNGVLEAAKAIQPPTIPAAKASAGDKLKAPQLVGMVKRYKVNRNNTTKSGKQQKSVKSQYQEINNITRKTKPLALNRLGSDELGNTKMVYDGSSILWAVDHQAVTTLHLKGDLPLRVVSFDRHGRLTGIRVAAGDQNVTLAEGTAQVAVQGYENGGEGFSGWEINSQLFKTNTVWALGDAAMIRVQNSQRIRVRGTNANTGLIDAADLLSHNLVTDVNKNTRSGWIQSVFPAGIHYIGVLLEEQTGAERLDVAIAAGSIPMQGSNLAPAQVYETEKGTLLIYPCTPSDSYNAILAIPKDNKVKVLGMYGLPSLPTDKQTVSNFMQLRNAGLDLTASAVKSAVVSIHSQKQAL